MRYYYYTPTIMAKISLAISMVGNNLEWSSSYPLFVEMLNSIATLEKGFVVSLKVKHTPTLMH